MHLDKMNHRKLFAPVFALLIFHAAAAAVLTIVDTFHVEGEQFFQVVQNSKTQDIYIGARNKIYHLDSTLKLKQEVTVGPIKDSQQCLPKRKCSSKTLTDNDIVVLEIEPISHYLFACGTVQQGACVAYNLADIQNSTHFDTATTDDFVGSNISTVAFFNPDASNTTSVLYVAMSYDGRRVDAYPKIMSERIISKTISGNYNLAYRKRYLGVSMDEDKLQTYPIKYLYGFKHNKFIYYVSVQGNATYIGRVCENGDFYYYVEIPILCWHNSISFNYATAARFFPTEGDQKLSVTYWNKMKNTSLLCIHGLNDIRKQFETTIKNCYSHANNEPVITPWIKKKKKCIETYDEDVTADTCGYDEFNGYITGGSIETTQKFIYEGKLTAIQLYNNHGTNVYLLGTGNGHLLKLVNFMLIMDTDISEGNGQPVEKDMELNKNQTDVYAITGSSLVRFPLNSCGVYTKCSTCVTTNDPLSCGWCHNKCTTRSECSNGWSPDCCVPQIMSINPTKGPVAGGTKLTIKGEYFDNENPNIKITVNVGSIPCSVVEYNSTNIFCLTQNDPSINKGNIHVKISSEGTKPNQPTIEGEDRSKEPFYFLIPEIYNFTPTYGPKSGGTKCNITGKNLDIGSSFSVHILDQKITVQKRMQDKVFAITPKVRSLISNVLKIQIDNQTLFTKKPYNFTQDPIILDVESPVHTIKSGGIDIVFNGKYLNTVQEPSLSGVIVKNGQVLHPEKCISNKSGTKLFCKIPKLIDNTSDTVSVDLRLLMDDVTELYNFGSTYPKYSRMYYQDDPVLHMFDSKKHIFLYSKITEHVEIKGERITDVVDKKDIKIMIGSINCTITSLQNKAILCKPTSIPTKNAEHHKFQVKVQIGYRTYYIGWLVFVSSSAQVNVSIIILVVILFCIFITIGVLFYCMRQKKLCLFKEKSSLPAARYAGNDQVHFGENGRLLINPNEYTERENFQTATTVNAGTASYPMIDPNILLALGEETLLIPKESLQITEKIGQGHFGCVYRALYYKPGEKGAMLVAVKTLHKDHPRDMDIQGFLDEALIMKDFDHENILSLIGICLGKDHMPLVVLPYMAHGDLLSYLRNVNNQPTVKDLIVFGISIASGMDYLASLKFVHRDLAARNCMLNDKLVVKVADFGLSRDIYERDYYSSDNKKSKLPVKWMALESLENGTYNRKTDVWSYGVVLWELFTRGVNPYPTVDNWDMPKYLKLGRRMEKPDYCPNRIYDIMLRCWEFDQNLRPDFSVIVKELTELSETEKHNDLPCYQMTPYVNVEY